MASHQAKVYFYRHERMPLPLSYLRSGDLVSSLDDALKLVQDVRQSLYGALYRLAEFILAPEADLEGGRNPDRSDVHNLIDHWGVERSYWSDLEPKFQELVVDLPEDGVAAIRRWQEALRSTAKKTLEQAEDLAGGDIRALKASVKAHQQLLAGLKKKLPNEKTEE